MGAIILDDVLTYLYESDVCMESYKELDDYVLMFEAGKPEVQAQVEANQKATDGAFANLKKAVDAIISFIKKCMEAISEFFKRLKMSKADKEAFEHFREVCKEDPELKNKKITVKDWTKLKKDYDELLKEAAETEKALYEGKVNDCQKLIERMGNFISGAAGGVAMSVSAEAAVRIAATSRAISKMIYTQFDKEGVVMEKLSASLGKHQANKVRKQVSSLRHVLSLQRAKMRMMNTYHKSVESAVFSIYDDIRGLGSGKSSIATYASIGSKMVGNKDVRKVITSPLGTAVRSAKNAAIETGRAKRDDKVRDIKKNWNARREAKGDFSHQSAEEAILGLNDEDSRIHQAIDRHIEKKQLKKAEKQRKKTLKKNKKYDEALKNLKELNSKY